MGTVDVAALAHQFGGGGHAKASGASVDGPLADAQTRVLEAARKQLAGG
jgi:phosphoesterase RecJ-like protein